MVVRLVTLALVTGSTAEATAAAPAELRVGSKAFTESVILGEIVTLLARSTGTAARHRAALGGTRFLWDALTRGEIDVYPEYSGTLVEEILPRFLPGAPTPTDAAGAIAGLRSALAARGIGLIGPLGFNNTYAIGVSAALAERLGLTAISELAGHPELRFGFSNEFLNRQDGWPALRVRYGLPQTRVSGLDHDIAYRAVADGAVEVTDLYATDPEIRYYHLRVLKDDRRGFPRYDALLLYRLDLGGRADDALAALRRLGGAIDDATMASMNARVKLDRRPETAVAAEFLRTALGVTVADSSRGVAATMARHTLEHLMLVGLSLLAAIAVAVPLGVLAAGSPRFAQGLLGAVGVVQTIPSLALLVFMIPLLGIGALPATMALFLYSLLPIVRNTHAGLVNVPASLRESAEALGLPPGAILRRVTLPLASPLIFAGIQSAAVINVGTATLGALVGAGGLGQPIFTGIRLDDFGLILQGAVPASLLALLVQGMFERVGRKVIPRGLRARGNA